MADYDPCADGHFQRPDAAADPLVGASEAAAGREGEPRADQPFGFHPAPLRPRHDGWSAERQRTFIEALADSGCVSDAADVANVTPRSAYRLRRRPGAEDFARAWDLALVSAAHRLTTLAFERAVYGTPRQIWSKGKVIGEERMPSDRLLMFLLAHLDKMRFGKLSGLLPVDLPDPRGEANQALPRLLDALKDQDEDAEGLLVEDYMPHESLLFAEPVRRRD